MALFGKTLLSLALLSMANASEPERMFTSSEGDKVNATFLGLRENVATLLRAYGATFDTPLLDLSEAGRKLADGNGFDELDAAALAGNLKIRDVKRYIDQGVPLMWSMCSMDEYNEIANENTTGRKSADAAFREKMDALAARISDKDKPEDNRHICMIIGYNEQTEELAVSDSWGKRFELRWVPLAAADWASNGKLFMILP